MKKKIGIGIGIFLILLIILGIITNYADGGRVSTGHEPKYCIKVISIFTDLVTGLERVADHATNIAFSILEKKEA